MENVVLIIHLLLALGLIGVVLLQRSEGGGLGMGGGGGVVTGRQAATALSKVTWVLAIAFIGTSMTLTIIAAQKSAGGSVLDRLAPAPQTETPAEAPAGAPPVPAVPPAGELLPPSPTPSPGESVPQVPRAD